ncbi:VOC family protein [Haliangium sp.]|uniref:VOC family protein n=1 Tax=Haliangium sp. TaxID=2663208 RepID=UPI003D1506FA
MACGFVRWEMRTTEVDRAQTFYEELLEQGAPDVTALPEPAIARGAIPHWLGHIGVEDKPATEQAFVERGATALGGGRCLRDPFGAMVALTTLTEPQRTDVIWQLHMSTSPKRARTDYAELCGMRAGERLELPGMGVFEQFTWGGGAVAGCLADIRDKPHIHPQWLYYFRVPDLERAIAYVNEHGGVVVGPMQLPDGRQVAACDDPLGAAFGLMQP